MIINEDQKTRINEAINFQELLLVGMEVLNNTIAHHGEGLVEVCGPISTGGVGSREGNLEIFSDVVDRLKNDGHIIFDAVIFEKKIDRLTPLFMEEDEDYCWALLNEFYLPIFESGAIEKFFFIHGWESSTWTTWEMEQAKRLDIPFVLLSERFHLG